MALVTPTVEFLARLDAVEQRLAVHATRPPPAGLTDPDPSTGEQWDAGQVWAHLAEFLPYWIGQARMLLSTRQAMPVSFGRLRSDPGRMTPIERDRHESPAVLMRQLSAAMADVRDLLNGLGGQDWSVQGRHPTLGSMSIEHLIDEFMIGHLEQHAAQLDSLAIP